MVPCTVSTYVKGVGKMRKGNGNYQELDVIFWKKETILDESDVVNDCEQAFDGLTYEEEPNTLSLQDGVKDHNEDNGYLCRIGSCDYAAKKAKSILKVITFKPSIQQYADSVQVRVMRTASDFGIVRCDYCIVGEDGEGHWQEFECSDEEFQSYTKKGLQYYAALHEPHQDVSQGFSVQAVESETTNEKVPSLYLRTASENSWTDPYYKQFH